MLDWLRGKKTYIVSAISVIGGLVLIIEGNLEQGIAAILAALGLGSLRAGISNAGNGN